MSKTISNLTAVSALASAELPVTQGGNSRRLSSQLILDAPRWNNAVRGRFPGAEVENPDYDTLGYYSGSGPYVSNPRGTITFMPTPPTLRALTRCPNFLHLSYPSTLSAAYPAMVWFLSREWIEAAGILISGDYEAGVAPASNVSRLSMKIGLVNELLAQHNLANMEVDFLLCYAADGAADNPSYNPADNILFSKASTTNGNGWGEPAGQPAQPDASFWGNGHTAGVHDDGIVTTYWHEDMPVPLNLDDYTFRGVKLAVRGDYTGSPALPLVLGVVNVAVIPASRALRGPADDDYYLQFPNADDIR